MKAVVIEKYGGADVLEVKDIPMPVVGDHDLLIEVYAASVNPVDWKIREGYLKDMSPYKFPLVLGWDVAGVVKETGAHVSLFKAGERVFSRTDIARNGTYAEYVAVDEGLVALIPDNLSFREAAAVPLACQTAWQALVEIAQVKLGDKVLIHAASGGVGTFALQIAKNNGAHVAATCGPQIPDWQNHSGQTRSLITPQLIFQRCFMILILYWIPWVEKPTVRASKF